MTPHCGCDNWQQENADGPWCGNCGHHINQHQGGCQYDPEEEL